MENTDALLEEKSEGCMLYIAAMFLFWNADQHLDIVTPLMTTKESIKELYKKWVHKELKHIKESPRLYRTDQIELVQDIENKLPEI